MELQIEHAHTEVHRKKSMTEELMAALLESSSKQIHSSICEDISNLRRYYEEKVYLSYSDDAGQYLQHMLHRAQNTTQEYVLGKVKEREFEVLADIRLNKYSLHEIKEQDKIKKIKEELSFKISDMRNSMATLNESQLHQQTEETYKRLMEFRKKGYWKEESAENQNVKQFLSKMKKQRKKLEREHKREMEKNEKKMISAQEREKNQKEEQARKIHEEKLERLQKMRDEKEKNEEEAKKKLEEAANLVKKMKNNNPVYIMNAEKFKNQVLIPMEQERSRKLAEWKKSRKPIDVEQLELHQQWYEEFKEKHNHAADKKEQDLQIQQKNMEKLNELFHGKFHQRFVKERNPLHHDYEMRKNQREKIMSYSMSVREERKPSQDPKKKEELSNLIQLLEQKKNKGKRRIEKEDGSVEFEDIPAQERHKIGVNYLEHLRNFNAGRRKVSESEKSQSLAQISQKPTYPDYLKDQRIKSQKTQGQLKSRSGLRKIINSTGSARQRYESSMDHFTVLDREAKRKEVQLKYMKANRKSMELKSELDQFYIDSVSLNLKMLKQSMGN